MTLASGVALGAVAPVFVWARPDNGWIKFGDNQPVSPQTGMIDSGGGTYSVAAGWSIKSMTLKCWPTAGGLQQTKDASYKNGEWAASIIPVAAGTYNVGAEMVLKKKGEPDRTVGTAFKTVVVK
jgi:hypothetical protein